MMTEVQKKNLSKRVLFTSETAKLANAISLRNQRYAKLRDALLTPDETEAEKGDAEFQRARIVRIRKQILLLYAAIDRETKRFLPNTDRISEFQTAIDRLERKLASKPADPQSGEPAPKPAETKPEV